MRTYRNITLCVLLVIAGPVLVWAGQAVPLPPTAAVGEAALQTPSTQPAGDSGPVFRTMELRFHPVNQSVIEPETYLYYIRTRPRSPSGGWVAYDGEAERQLLDDFRRLWDTNFLDDLWIEVNDSQFENGVVGKRVIFHLEERQRVKIVNYTGPGADKLDSTKIDEKLAEENLQIRLDSFLDPRTVSLVQDTIREMLAEKGYQFGSVSHEITEVAGGPKLVHLTFNIEHGPKVKIRKIEFLGNQKISAGTLKKKMEANKESWWLSFMSGRGKYQEAKFAEDAESIVEYYRSEGYITARVGEPQLRVLDGSSDSETSWVELRIPVTEGERYRIGQVDYDGNEIVKTEVLEPLFKLKPGDFYDEGEVRKGLEKAREVYGSVGYMEFVAFPELLARDQMSADNGNDGDVSVDGAGARPIRAPDGAPFVDVTMRVQEGTQYFVNRITFVGNSTTRDNVIRREMRLFERGVFNSEALKFSIRRLNQLGYFQSLGPDAISVEKTPGDDTQVDVTLTLEEQNRNQLTFGAGVSQFEGFFGQLAFQTANFMGRGETFSASVQRGSRAENYQLGFTEPYLFDRNLTGGINVYKRDIIYISQFTQESLGGDLTLGFPLANFTRMFFAYGYQRVRVTDINVLYCDPLVLARNPFLRDSLLLGGQTCVGGTGQTTQVDPLSGVEITTPTVGGGGQRIVSRISPTVVHNTVDNPISPHSGRRYTLGFDLAGVGGNTRFVKPSAEGVWYIPHTSRTTFGFRASFLYVRPYGNTRELPIFERLFLGGEYSVRGYDLRSIGPTDAETRLVVGGNKSLLVNAEYLIDIVGPVRLVLFYDAAQVRGQGDPFAWKEPVFERVQTVPWAPSGTDGSVSLLDISPFSTFEVGQTSAFKTSTGLELRFFMPVLNVPFRLIAAYNPQRENVYDNSLQPQQAFEFRFAVGSTF